MHFVALSDIFQNITLLTKSVASHNIIHHSPTFYRFLKTTDLSFSLAGYVYIRIRHVAHAVLVEIFAPCCWCEPLKLGGNHQG